MKRLVLAVRAWWARPPRTHPNFAIPYELLRLTFERLGDRSRPSVADLERLSWSEWRAKYPGAAEPDWAPK